MAKWAAIAGKPEYKNEGMIYVWLGAFIPCIVFPFFRELAYSLCYALHSPDVSIRPSIPKARIGRFQINSFPYKLTLSCIDFECLLKKMFLILF